MIINTVDQLAKFYFTALNYINILIRDKYISFVNGKHIKMRHLVCNVVIREILDVLGEPILEDYLSKQIVCHSNISK